MLDEEVDRISAELAERPDPAYWLNVTAYDARLRLVAANGVTIAPERSHTREADVDVRVGSPALDTPTRSATRLVEDEPKDTIFLPVDGDERATRLAVWRATDDAYRQAQKRLLKVRANLAVKVESEDASPDFSSSPVTQDAYPPHVIAVDVEDWRSRLARVSAQALEHADVHESNVSLDAVAATRVILNSEGTRLILPRSVYVLTLSVNTTAEDGAAPQVYESILAARPDELPDEDALSLCSRTWWTAWLPSVMHLWLSQPRPRRSCGAGPPQCSFTRSLGTASRVTVSAMRTRDRPSRTWWASSSCRRS